MEYEYPVLWSHIRTGLRYREDENGYVAHPKSNSLTRVYDNSTVSVTFKPTADQTEIIRDWLNENQINYQMIGKFHLLKNICNGVRFVFDDAEVALIFKMKFG